MVENPQCAVCFGQKNAGDLACRVLFEHSQFGVVEPAKQGFTKINPHPQPESRSQNLAAQIDEVLRGDRHQHEQTDQNHIEALIMIRKPILQPLSRFFDARLIRWIILQQIQKWEQKTQAESVQKACEHRADDDCGQQIAPPAQVGA